MKRAVSILIISTLFVYAKIDKAPVKIEMKSYKKSFVVDKNGKKVVKWLKPTKVIPGDIIKYVDIIKNSSDKDLDSATITNKIDKNLIFIPNSISSDLKYKVEFSVDKNLFANANKLVIKKGNKMVKAQPKDYRAIRFKLLNVPKHSVKQISYQVKIK